MHKEESFSTSSGRGKAEVIMCTFKRPINLSTSVECLNRQISNFNGLTIWDNGNQIKEIKERIEAAKFPVNIIQSRRNIGGIGRFYAARRIAKLHPYFIFIDDDQAFSDNSLQTLISEADENKLVAWWTFTHGISGTYWDRKATQPGDSNATYCGTGGMICPAHVFKHKSLFKKLPKKFEFIEDLWISFFCKYELGMQLCKTKANFLMIEDEKYKNQWKSLSPLKEEFFTELSNHYKNSKTEPHNSPMPPKKSQSTEQKILNTTRIQEQAVFKINSKRKNLILTRCGNHSLHQAWSSTEIHRSYDIIGIAYEDLSLDSFQGLDFSETILGSKSPGYYQWIQSNPWIFEQYEYIGLFDDDIKANTVTLNALFKYTKLLNLCVSQPALTSESWSGLLITKRHQSFMHRWTNFIEIMCPIFSSETLQVCSDSFKYHDGGGGCTEAYWLAKCSPILGKTAIIDALPVTHTRRSGAEGSGDRSQINHQISRNRMRMVMAQTGFYLSKDNLCGLSLEGNFLHMGDIDFVNLLNNDALHLDPNRMSMKNKNGHFIESKFLLNQYHAKNAENFEAFNNGGACKELLEQLATVAIYAGIACNDLSAICRN